jgi:integrase/recombinase XerD
MPTKLSTTLNKILLVRNSTNSELINEFRHHMHSKNCSERHQNNTLQAIIGFANFLGPNVTFYQLERKEQVLAFLDTKIKSVELDPDEKWITTWNHYIGRIKLFSRWLVNRNGESNASESDWQTPKFAQIKEKKTNRKSPYSESQIWDLDEFLSIVKYEPEIRNKAILALLWDLDARNHEVTMLKIKHIRLRERYAEGEIPYNTKTGGGPILLTCSFPYVRDWLNKHPFKNSPEARLICNLQNGAPIKPDALWTMMKQLRNRIVAMLENGSIKEQKEKEKLEFLLRTKRWNPYCIRHSAITNDSDYLPEYALKKKVRWSMNSGQPSRYIKPKMGPGLKRIILAQNGISLAEDEALKPSPSVRECPRCNLVNTFECKYCSKCTYPLVPDAFDEIKEEENSRLERMEEQYRHDIKNLEEKMDQRLNQVLSMIKQNPVLAHVKSEVLTKKNMQ